MEEFIYELNKNTLTIKKCPDNTLSYSLISSIVNYNCVEKLIIEEGVERILLATFNCCFNLRKVTLPNSLTVIEDAAFKNCTKLKNIKLPPNIKHIKLEAFRGCSRLEKINIPEGVEVIERGTFSDCKNLKKVIIPEGVKIIEGGAFSNCKSLNNVQLPSSVCFIGEEAFDHCESLIKISVPEGVEELNYTFNHCENLKRVTLPSSLKIITNSAFSNCSNLSKIELPSNLEIIGDYAFCKTRLWKVNIPSSVKTIGEYAFKNCDNLFDVTFNEGLTKIEEGAFLGCHNISQVELPDTVKHLGLQAFRFCFNLKKIELSKSLEMINNDVFSSCYKLKKIIIPEGVTDVNYGAFNNCKELEEIHFPSTLEYFFQDTDFWKVNRLTKIVLNSNQGEKVIDCLYMRFVNNIDCRLLVNDFENQIYSFFYKGEFVEFSKSLLIKNKNIRNLIDNGKLAEEDFIRVYHWTNRKVIPSAAVIKTMPIEDIDKFFMNKNCNEWAKLVKESSITYVDDVKSFFKLCYVLGVFSESTSVRDTAVNFIRENIIGKLRGMDIHAKFDGFDLGKGFNKDYAEFFMKYYNNEDFMIYVDEDEDKMDLMAASYNNFEQVKKVYPNRTLHTNRKADLLLPEHVINAISSVQYNNIDEGNEEFAALIGRYGYNEEQFEMLQDWYNKAKRIKKEDMKLFISDDEEEKGIAYELLKKDDIRGAILGNITNCCQVAYGAGEECVEYGLIKPNSGFITFNYKGKIIGQAWVWYDELTSTVCLDNIEIPHRYLEKINENKQIQESFIKCLLRIQENLKKEMSKNGLEVSKVTIGKGYNDLGTILEKKFETDNQATKLSDYRGYSDAKRQFEIKRKR